MGALKLAAVIAVVATLGGCTFLPARTIYVPACAGWSPIIPLREDVPVTSTFLKGQILAHNNHGKNTCGWAKPNTTEPAK